MGIKRSMQRVAEARLQGVASSLLEASTLCAIATVGNSDAHIHTAYFAWTPEFRLVWLSEPAAAHSLNIRDHPSVAIAVFDSNQRWSHSDHGIQLFGQASELSGKAAEAASHTYADRFIAYSEFDVSAYRFYEFRAQRLKLFDETTLGSGTFVTARVGPGTKLTWEKTEIYDSSV